MIPGSEEDRHEVQDLITKLAALEEMEAFYSTMILETSDMINLIIGTLNKINSKWETDYEEFIKANTENPVNESLYEKHELEDK